MKTWKVALLIASLLTISAGIGLAEDKADAPCKKTCEKVCTAVIDASDGEQKQIKVEIAEEDGRSLIEVWEMKDGDDVLLKKIETDDRAEAMAELGEIDGLENIRLMFLDEDDVFVAGGDPQDRRIEKVIRKKGSPHGSYFVASRAWLGVALMDLSGQLNDYFDVEDGGALVSEVMEDSPAEAAGLKAGDVIVKIEGEEIEDTDDLHEALGGTEAEQKVKVEVLRKGDAKTFEVTLGEAPETKILKHIEVLDDGDNTFTIRSPRVKRHLPRIEHRDGDEDVMFFHKDDSEDMEEMRQELKKLKQELKEIQKELKK